MKMRKMTKTSGIKKELFNELFNDKKFFDDIRKFMENTDWTWGLELSQPTFKDMKEVVIHLGKLSYPTGNCCESGGFAVELNDRRLKVYFQKYTNDDVVFERTIDISDIREKKLNRILC